MTLYGPLTPQLPCSPISKERPLHPAQTSAPAFVQHFLNGVGFGRLQSSLVSYGCKWNETERFRCKMEQRIVPVSSVTSDFRLVTFHWQHLQIVAGQGVLNLVKARKSFIFSPRKAFSLNHPKNHFVPQSFCLSVPSSASAVNALLKIKSHKPIQGGHKPKQGYTSQYKAKQGPKKNRNTSLVHKPSPDNGEPQRGSILQPSGCEARATPGQPKPNTPHPESGCISSSITNLQLTIFNLQFPPAPLTSSRPIAIPAKRQASDLLEPHCLSRVVKVRQASEKTAPSSLDVKPSLNTASLDSHWSQSQIPGSQSHSKLRKARKSFPLEWSENLPIKPCTATLLSNFVGNKNFVGNFVGIFIGRFIGNSQNLERLLQLAAKRLATRRQLASFQHDASDRGFTCSFLCRITVVSPAGTGMMQAQLTMSCRRLFAVRCALLSLVACVSLHRCAQAQILDNGIDPANLGKGDWIYFLEAATNKLGGSVPSVKNVSTLMSYYKSIGMQFLVVKAGTGSTNFNNNQFSSSLVNAAHAAGLKIFGYTRSFGTDIPGEIALAANVYNLGADGFVLDAEAEWESAHLGANGPALAIQLCSGIKAQFPTKFLSHAPFPVISYHSSFPYKEFGYYCDAVMPQDYWTSIGVTPEYMANWMDQEWRAWQNGLTGIWTNAIKPLAPIAQGWSPSMTEITTGTQVTTFADALKNDPSPVTVGGYRGISFWRADLHTNDVLAAMAAIDMTPPLRPTLAIVPPSIIVPDGGTATFSVITTGAPPFTYQWRFNSNNIPSATSASYTITNAQISNGGLYSVIVSNSTGGMLSSNGTLVVQEFISDVHAFPGTRSAVIIWKTRQPASAQVEYGQAASLGTFTAVDSRPKTNQTVLLAGLESGSNYYFRVLSTNATNTSRSSISNFTTAGTLIVDNPDAAYTGGWTLGTSSADKYGGDYRFVGTVAGPATATASFTPNLPSAGYYSVYVWYPQGSNRSTNAPLSLIYPGGTLNYLVDQTTGGGGWRLLASNLFLPAGNSTSVQVANNAGYTGKVVMADGVQFVYAASQDTPSDVSVPAWWATAYFGTTNINASLDPDGDGYPTWMEYVLGTNPTRADSRLDIRLEKLDGTTFRAVCSPVLAGRFYEWQTRTSAVQGAWMSLTNPISVNADGSGQTLISNAPPQGILRIKANLQ
jgi:hypothetical protein